MMIPVILVALILFNGCSGGGDGDRRSAGKPVNGLVDGVSGYSKVKAGHEAMDKIKQISAEHKDELEEVMQ